MFLDTSALYLLERHRAYEAELQRDGVMARHRLHGKLRAHPHTLLADIDEAEVSE